MLSADKKNGIMKAMETIIKKIDKNQIDEDAIREAGEILREGGLVAFPTETVYGLGANALDEEAAKKTYEAKGRPSDNPLIVHFAPQRPDRRGVLRCDALLRRMYLRRQSFLRSISGRDL